jgi:hypothetical protein
VWQRVDNLLDEGRLCLATRQGPQGGAHAPDEVEYGLRHCRRRSGRSSRHVIRVECAPLELVQGVAETLRGRRMRCRYSERPRVCRQHGADHRFADNPRDVLRGSNTRAVRHLTDEVCCRQQADVARANAQVTFGHQLSTQHCSGQRRVHDEADRRQGIAGLALLNYARDLGLQGTTIRDVDAVDSGSPSLWRCHCRPPAATVRRVKQSTCSRSTSSQTPWPYSSGQAQRDRRAQMLRHSDFCWQPPC